jgi:hypothetical protein
MRLMTAALSIALLLHAPATALAQWPKRLPAGTPTTADGKPDPAAPAPRTPDGKPDLSGVWETAPAPRPAGTPAGRGAQPPAAPAAPGTFVLPGNGIFSNVGGQTPERMPPYQPWALALVKQRVADNSKDNPDAHCLPMGIMQLTSHPFPRKIIQTPTEVVIVYEASGTTVREIFLDGRTIPMDAEPWWNGYSVGRWEGDTLVVQTSNFTPDAGWLDVSGSPLTPTGTITERLRRPTFGSLEIDVTIDDPKAYTRPFRAKVYNRLMPDSQLIEFVCIDKDAQHYVGAAAK